LSLRRGQQSSEDLLSEDPADWLHFLAESTPDSSTHIGRLSRDPDWVKSAVGTGELINFMDAPEDRLGETIDVGPVANWVA
jgi:hypothetical protein